ncbi:MAG: amino acid adenylation domain-containing protein [Cyanothece sp. SIO2G6]|nr:amino acid adenylation domain-containing protein [Cyanothece sp. SIO2G6]
MNTTLSRNIQTIYPATPMQQGMLFHSTYAAESGIYVEQLQIVLDGTIDPEALRQAWQQLVNSHDVLRTCFVWQRTQTLQVVLKQVELPWQQHDWQHIAADQQPQKLQEWLRRDQQTVFETTKAPLMRCTLITLTPNQHQLIWTHHHALLDGWSLPLLMQDLLANYQGQARSPRRKPYQAYVAWLQQQERETVETYWRQKLSGFQTPTPLPLQEQETGPATDFHRWEHLLSAELTEEIQQWARQQRMSLATLIYGVWGILLSRYSGEADVVFGITVSGRDIPLDGVEDMVGLFINTLPLRLTLSPDCSGDTLLKQLQHDLQDLQGYSYMPLVDIQRLSEVSHTLFNTLVVVENYPIAQALRGYQQTLPIQTIIASERTNYPLNLVVIPGEQLSLNFDGDGDRFPPDAVERLGQHFEILLRAIVQDSSRAIATLPLLTDAEQQLLTEWNQTTVAYPHETWIHQQFEQQVKQTPDAIAVVAGDTQLTYQALNIRANQLAHYLQALGVGADILVGICVERSPEMVVGLLAVLKAGGAYVPIDPDYPAARIQFMLQDTQVPVLLTQTHLLERLPEITTGPGVDTQVICLDGNWETIAERSLQNPATKIRADHPAYVIFTSGSTGRPKGVMVPHRAISNQMQWIQQTFPLAATDKFLQRTNFSFDASVWEFYAPLLAGGQLIFARPGRFLDGDYLIQTIREQNITYLQLVPSLLRVLVSHPDFSQCQSLKHVFCGGEALAVDLSQEFHSQIDACLHNLYGPTEACINSTYWTCQSDESAPSIPIGRPIANAQAYILDANLQQVPIGALGELHMGGVGLAKGYLNRPELTAEKFITNPFGPGHLYKTGDRARYRPDGAIEYLGRIDHQVKIRGFRIEMGEIEAALLQHEQVSAGVVLVREDETGDQRLVAYIVVSGEIAEVDLKVELRQNLPDYMVPMVIVPLDEMPLMPNGKVDRKALPAPAFSPTETFVAPQTERQTLIASLFADVLSVPAETLGIHDNFFDLGGHSLLAMRLITSLRQALETEISLKVLFETPTVAGIDAALDSETAGGLDMPPITPTPRDDAPIPLSYAQERLWFLAQLEGVSGTYNMPGVVRVEGTFDVAKLQQAVNAIVCRHETLRTTFPVVNGTAIQRIHPTMDIPVRSLHAFDLSVSGLNVSGLSVSDLSVSGLNVSRLNVSVSDWLNHEVKQPFDLTTGPLLRLALVHLEADVAILVVTMHHIISDGWSISIFIRELIALYRTDSENQPLSELPIQYADYAQWQRQWLQGEVLATQLDYWRQQLAGAPTLLELPTDHPRPAVQSFRGQTQVVMLPKALGEQVKVLARKHQVTLFMTLLAAFQLLLYRYSKQRDIVVGTSIANRQQPELESLIGLFVNTLVLRLPINETASVKDFLHRVKQMTLEAYSHKDVPFEQVVEALQPQRSLAHSPLFQVMFMLQNMPRSPLELPNMTVTPLPAASVTAKCDLLLSVEESDQGLICEWEHSTDLFEPETIGRMAHHFEVLLTAMVTDDSQAIATMPLLTTAEQRQFAEWNATAAPHPDLCLHTLIDRQAQQTPEAVAVAFEADQLTYQELNTKADCLAHYLQSMGIGPDSLVGICVERSVDMMVGLLGILKAGSAYIPLDPNYPPPRLAFMVDDANVEVLISQSWLQDLLPNYRGKTVCLDQPIPAVVTAPTSPTQADNLAYMIYTSGSTGRPKGVQITHNAVVDLIHSQRQDLGITSADTILSAASFSFDMSVLELWLPLVVGAQLVLVSREVAQDGLRLAAQINTRGVTLMQATPATWRMLLDANWSGSTQLQIICGGEALTPDLARDLRERCATLRNFYGPTEVTVWATQQEITDSTPITVGRPLTNTQVYILDELLNPVPVGVPGDLYLGGVRLARGYYKRPSLTAERFVPNPFGQIPGDRLYRTGDLARYLPDGTIDYLGRADYQVKLRGFRIELGEIEAVLDRHEQVRQCTVVVHKDKADQERLVAYVVSDTDTQQLKLQLKQHLRQHLPDYMVPNVVMCLPALPLTPNGKVDRKALPEPNYERTTEFVAPQTEPQKLIAALFAKILTSPVEQVGIYDNFFELGGHSLLATQVIARMRQIFHVNISVRQLFETPTVAELATWVGEQRQTQQDMITRCDRHQPLPLSFAQERLWFLEQLYPDSAVYNQTVAVRLTGNLHLDPLHHSLQTIVDRHEILRTTFILHQGQPIQQIAPTLTTTLPVVDLRSLSPTQQPEEVQRLATAADQEVFDITQGPLFRASVLQLQDQEYILLWTIHHIISDIWSTGVLVHELSTLYTAYTTASLPLLESLPIQYADFAVWQRQWLTDEVLDQQLAYWRQKLGGQLPVLKLPADYPPPETPSFQGDMSTFHLSAALASKLHQLSQSHGTTLFMTLLAGFKALLYVHSGQPDMMVGTDIANRNRTEIEGLIGFFINLLVLRTDLSGNPTFQDLLQRVREVTLESYAHQDLPFSQLVQALQPDARRSGVTPFVQVLFVMQNAPFNSFELLDLTLTPVTLNTHSARFDLALFVSETPTGLTVSWNYSGDRFTQDTISRLAQQFETLLSQVVAQPDIDLETLTSMVTQPQAGSKGAKGAKRRKKFKRVTPQAVQQATTDLVTIQPLPCGVMTVQPNNHDVNLVLWAKGERAALNDKLLKHGALLFRGFSIETAKDFEQAAVAICPDLFGEYGDLPRTGVSDKVYGSTPYPEDKAILFHNESSHLQQWPMKIWFCCLQPAKQGGATPIVDCRKAYQLLSPEMRDRLHQKQLMYVRNYIKGLDVAWQDFFHTDDRAVVEQRCQAAGVEWEWLADDGLQTRQIRPALVRHPLTGEWVVFNQLQLHHLSYLDQPTQQSLLSLFGEDRLPRQVYYGDGSTIEPEVLNGLQAAYTEAEQVFDWQQGDIIMLDNMLMAHGRHAYTGSRMIAVAMGEMMTQAKLSQIYSVTSAAT